MKNGYVGAENGEIIKGYAQKKDKIVVTFLDGAFYEVPLSTENEEELIKIMLGQAIDRNNSSTLSLAKEKRKKAVKWIITEAIIGVITATAAVTTDNKLHRVIAGVLAGLSGIAVVVNGIRYAINNEEIQELEKYGIYLSIKEALDNCTDENLFNGIRTKVDRIDINTLDNFSLADIKKVKANLRRIELMRPHFPKSGR